MTTGILVLSVDIGVKFRGKTYQEPESDGEAVKRLP
jgi:hypothetical protein